MARTYHWPTRLVERELTDEVLILYLDEATDRLVREQEGEFVKMVEAQRIGTIFAHNLKAYQSWARSLKSAVHRPVGLKGEALESVLRAFALSHPEYVVVGPRAE